MPATKRASSGLRTRASVTDKTVTCYGGTLAVLQRQGHVFAKFVNLKKDRENPVPRAARVPVDTTVCVCPMVCAGPCESMQREDKFRRNDNSRTWTVLSGIYHAVMGEDCALDGEDPFLQNAGRSIIMSLCDFGYSDSAGHRKRQDVDFVCICPSHYKIRYDPNYNPFGITCDTFVQDLIAARCGLLPSAIPMDPFVQPAIPFDTDALVPNTSAPSTPGFVPTSAPLTPGSPLLPPVGSPSLAVDPLQDNGMPSLCFADSGETRSLPDLPLFMETPMQPTDWAIQSIICGETRSQLCASLPVEPLTPTAPLALEDFPWLFPAVDQFLSRLA